MHTELAEAEAGSVMILIARKADSLVLGFVLLNGLNNFFIGVSYEHTRSFKTR